MKNIVREEEIACNKQFLLFSQCFLPYMVLIFHFKCTVKCRMQFFFNLDWSKILFSGNGFQKMGTGLIRFQWLKLMLLYLCVHSVYVCLG